MFKNTRGVREKIIKLCSSYEYEESGLNIKNLKQLMAEKRVMYDHNIDQKGYKWSGKSILKKIETNLLPKYVSENIKEFKEWID